MNFLLEAVIIMPVGFCFLRIAGKKTIAEMTSLEMITVLAMGTIIGHAVSENSLWKTIITMGIFVGFILISQYLSLKFNIIEKFLIGKATLVIKDGKVITKNLKKLRLTADQLEMRLRQNGISYLSHVKTATMESNGLLGVELFKHAAPVTLGQLDQRLNELKQILQPSFPQKKLESNIDNQSDNNLFEEVILNEHKQRISSKLE